MKVLILDDSLVHRKIIKNSIKHLGAIEIIEAENGQQGLDKFAGVDLIITDCNMEGMDGLEFTKRVRMADEKIPVIMMSSNNAPEDLENAFACGVSEYIIKPFNNKDLEDKVAKYFKKAEDLIEIGYAVAFEEKRRHIRYPFVLAVKHRMTDTGVFLDSYCSDISLGGLRLLAGNAYRMGDTMELEVHFPEEVMEPFHVFGRVRWCLPSEEFKGKFHIGVHFTGLTETQSEIVKQLIETEKEIYKGQ